MLVRKLENFKICYNNTSSKRNHTSQIIEISQSFISKRIIHNLIAAYSTKNRLIKSAKKPHPELFSIE
jgi:hypothetical protein